MGEGIVGVEREAEWSVAEFGAAVLSRSPEVWHGLLSVIRA